MFINIDVISHIFDEFIFDFPLIGNDSFDSLEIPMKLVKHGIVKAIRLVFWSQIEKIIVSCLIVGVEDIWDPFPFIIHQIEMHQFEKCRSFIYLRREHGMKNDLSLIWDVPDILALFNETNDLFITIKRTFIIKTINQVTYIYLCLINNQKHYLLRNWDFHSCTFVISIIFGIAVTLARSDRIPAIHSTSIRISTSKSLKLWFSFENFPNITYRLE